MSIVNNTQPTCSAGMAVRPINQGSSWWSLGHPGLSVLSLLWGKYTMWRITMNNLESVLVKRSSTAH